MRPLFAFSILLLSWTVLSHLAAQTLNVQTFGDPAAPPVVYIHGGPGYNSVPFERLVADSLAAAGLYVLSYDRRGEGRHESIPARHDFAQSITDLDSILNAFEVESAVLIGHSFGGMVATKFAISHPDRVKALALLGAPISVGASLSHIERTVTDIYRANNDTVNLAYIDMLADMDTTSMMYASYCFSHALQAGLYRSDSIDDYATSLYQRFATDSLLMEYGPKFGMGAAFGFWSTEKYTTIDLSAELRQIVDNRVPVVGLYGEEDGLYPASQLEHLGELIGPDKVTILENCSHNVFIDRQATFIRYIKYLSR